LINAAIPLAYPRLEAQTILGAASTVANIASNLIEKLDHLILPGENWASSFRKTGAFKTITNTLNEPELADDLNDHWTSDGHIVERDLFIKKLQNIARNQSLRVTFLSGDVHVCGGGKFASAAATEDEKDHRLMYQIVHLINNRSLLALETLLLLQLWFKFSTRLPSN
jgi:hypothetical protein